MRPTKKMDKSGGCCSAAAMTKALSTAQELEALERAFHSFRTQVNSKLSAIQQILLNRTDQSKVDKDFMNKDIELVESLLATSGWEEEPEQPGRPQPEPAYVFNEFLLEEEYAEEEEHLSDPDYRSGDDLAGPVLFPHSPRKKPNLKIYTPTRNLTPAKKQASSRRAPNRKLNPNRNRKVNGHLVQLQPTKPKPMSRRPVPLQDPLKLKPEPQSDSDDGAWPEGYTEALDGIPLDQYELKLKCLKTESTAIHPASSLKPGPSSRGISYVDVGRVSRTPRPRTKRKSKPLTMRAQKRIKKSPSRVIDSGSLIFEEYRTTYPTALWTYFLREVSGGYGKCRTCNLVIKTYGGTTALWRHVNKNCSAPPAAVEKTDEAPPGHLRLGEEYMEDNDSFLGTCPIGGPIIEEFDSAPDYPPVVLKEDVSVFI